MVSQGRATRVSQRIKKELSEMLIFEVSDPRLQGVFISDVQVDRELSYASIWVSALEGKEREEEILEGLNNASGFLRSQLARRVDMRSFPQMRFHWDPTPEHAARIDQLISSLGEKDNGDDDDNNNDSE